LISSVLLEPWTDDRLKVNIWGKVRYTSKKGTVYAIVTRLPESMKLTLPFEFTDEAILLSNGSVLQTERVGQNLSLELPDEIQKDKIPVIKLQEKNQ